MPVPMTPDELRLDTARLKLHAYQSAAQAVASVKYHHIGGAPINTGSVVDIQHEAERLWKWMMDTTPATATKET